MKILLAQDTYLPIVGGAEVHVSRLAGALRAKHHEVQIVTCTPGSSKVQGVEILRLPRTGSRMRAFVWLALNIPRCAALVRRYDVVHAHYSYLLAAVLAVWCRVLDRALVVTLHGLNTLDSSVGRSPLRRVLRRVSISLADYVLATSEEIAEVARRYASHDRVVLIPNGVAVDEFETIAAREPEGPPFQVLALRRLVHKTGVQYLVEAAPRIVAAMKERVAFTIVGDGPLRPYLERRVRALGMEDRFHFRGILANEHIHTALGGAHVVVFPSSAESTSIAALEAMAARRPVVASALGALSELLGHGERGKLVGLFDRISSDYRAPLTLPERRIRDLANAVIDTLTDRATALRRADAALAYVRAHHDWDVISEQIERIYEQALLRHARVMVSGSGSQSAPPGPGSVKP